MTEKTLKVSVELLSVSFIYRSGFIRLIWFVSSSYSSLSSLTVTVCHFHSFSIRLIDSYKEPVREYLRVKRVTDILPRTEDSIVSFPCTEVRHSFEIRPRDQPSVVLLAKNTDDKNTWMAALVMLNTRR